MPDPAPRSRCRPPRMNPLSPSAWLATRRRRGLALLLLTLLALVLRLSGIGWGLPSETRTLRSYHPDEGAFMNAIPLAADLFHYRDTRLALGSWHMLLSGATLQAADALGFIEVVRDRSYYESNLPALDGLYRCGRALSALLSALTVAVAYHFGKVYAGRTAGMLAAAVLALTPLAVIDAHYFYVTAPHLFWGLLGWLALSRCALRPQPRRLDFFTVGLSTMLAVFTQLNAGIIFFLLPAAVFFRWRLRLPFWPWRTAVRWLAAGTVAGCLLGCPQACFDPGGFLHEFRGVFASHFARTTQMQPRDFQENVFRFYGMIALPEAYGPLVAPAVWLAVAALVMPVTPARGLLLAALVLNGLLLAMNNVYLSHYLTLLLPALAVALADLLQRPVWPRVRLVVTGIVLAQLLVCSVMLLRLLHGTDPRTAASDWLLAHLPPGTTIGVNQVYFYSVPAVQQRDTPYRIGIYNFDLARLDRERPDYFLLCDFEFSMGNRLLHPAYRPELGSSVFFRALGDGSRYSPVRTFARRSTWGGFTWPDNPTWHMRYHLPTVWLLRRHGGAAPAPAVS